MSRRHLKLNPQQLYDAGQFFKSLKSRTLRTNDLRFLLVHLRETWSGNIFREWGSAIAHNVRNRGELFGIALNVLATHIYYEKLNRNKIQFTPLPAFVLNCVYSKIESFTPQEVNTNFGDIYPGGVSKDELLAFLEYLYGVRKPKKGRHEENHFYHLYCSGAEEMAADVRFVSRMILDVENDALGHAPMSLSEVVDEIEAALLTQIGKKEKFSPSDRSYLQLHILVAFHNQEIDLCPKLFKSLTGHPLEIDASMAFVSNMDETLTLDVGFFQLENGHHLEPISIRQPYSVFKRECFYQPVLVSDLPGDTWLVESDENISVTLYNHPLRVAKYKGSYFIMAENREATRFQPTRSRFNRR